MLSRLFCKRLPSPSAVFPRGNSEMLLKQLAEIEGIGDPYGIGDLTDGIVGLQETVRRKGKTDVIQIGPGGAGVALAGGGVLIGFRQVCRNGKVRNAHGQGEIAKHIGHGILQALRSAFLDRLRESQ